MIKNIKNIESDLFKLKFLLKQKTLPENFIETGEGYSEEVLSKVTITSFDSPEYYEKLVIQLPLEIGDKSLASSGLRIAALIGNRNIDGSHVVAADTFRILLDQDLAAPLQDLANSPFYLASTFQKDVTGVIKVKSPEEAGDLIKILSVKGDAVIIRLRHDLSSSILKIFGIDITSDESDIKGASYCISIHSLVSGVDKVLEEFRAQEGATNSLGGIANQVLGVRTDVISYNMIVDGVIGVGLETAESNRKDWVGLANLFNTFGVPYNHYSVGGTYV